MRRCGPLRRQRRRLGIREVLGLGLGGLTSYRRVEVGVPPGFRLKG